MWQYCCCRNISQLLPQTMSLVHHSNKYAIVLTLGWCVVISTVILLFFSCTVKDEWPLSQWALLPLLLPTLPQPHCSQARLLAPRTHVHLSSWPRGWSCCAGSNRDVKYTVSEWSVCCRKWRIWVCGREMEASLDRTSRVSVLSERAGHDRGVPHSIQSREQDWLYVHSLCSKCKVGNQFTCFKGICIKQLTRQISRSPHTVCISLWEYKNKKGLLQFDRKYTLSRFIFNRSDWLVWPFFFIYGFVSLPRSDSMPFCQTFYSHI